MRGSRWLVVMVVLALAAGFGKTWGQTLQLRVESRDLYAELPFILTVNADGFDEEPSPEAPALEIPGCRVTYLGVNPNVSQGLEIINGQRREWRRVTFSFRYRVEAPSAGNYTVPALTVTQGSNTASTRPAALQVKPIASTQDMQVHLELPDRPVWIGETFEADLVWLLRRDVQEHNFVVPLFDLDFVQIQPVETSGGRALNFTAGARNIELTYTQDTLTVKGKQFTRLRFPFLATINRAGPIQLEPVKVAATLEAGRGRDIFGFRSKRYELFKAEDQPRRISVRPLPQQGRPDSFENAIGTAYSIGVRANRTVVQVGDPVELEILVRGNGSLEGLTLPKLSGPEGLPIEHFSVPSQIPIGEYDPEQKGKKFKVTVRIKSAETREIPSVAFSYFDPELAEYRTVRSQPIALSVAGSAVVGAGDVLAAPSRGSDVGRGNPEIGGGSAGGASTNIVTLIGADLSLSDSKGTLRRVWSSSEAVPLLAVLYILPLIGLTVRIWQVRSSGRRGKDSEIRSALQELEDALDLEGPAREAVPKILNALRNLARLTGQEGKLRSSELTDIETRAFDPAAAQKPLAPDVLDRVRATAHAWAEAAREPSATGRTALLIGLMMLGLPALNGPVRAQQNEPVLEKARETYRAALEETDRVRRTRLFGEAERLLRKVVAMHPDSPDLLTDWGNAALGAQDIGRATLAYRRALRLDPDHDRAQKNLAWLRARAPDWLPRRPERGAIDSLFFWHHTLSVSQRFLVGAVAFAIAILLVAPWPGKRNKLLRRIALPIFLVWIATTTSAFLTPRAERELIVIEDGAILRSADSLGAPAALANPLPAGAELRLVEKRGSWIRVSLADGTRGWLTAGSTQNVAGRIGPTR